MITEIMQAMVERAPKKARQLQNKGKGKLEAYVRMIVKQAREEIEMQNVPEDDPALAVMVREIAMANALEGALADETLDQETT